jgi:CheY-like chemotaxis protein
MSIPYIVIVDDNPADIELLRFALNEVGEPYDLVALQDGAEALQFVQERYLEISEPHPCVVLLDFHLPKYDGLEVLAALKRQPSLRHIHVVVLTSGALRPTDEAKIQSLGALFREKPRHYSEVLLLAADILELCAGRTPASWENLLLA